MEKGTTKIYEFMIMPGTRKACALSFLSIAKAQLLRTTSRSVADLRVVAALLIGALISLNPRYERIRIHVEKGTN